ncbi:ATP-binding protein [Thermoclostridium stercorarium]|uniref:sensor histidine kinase n=1 Tax=Thermoclostridium stercorarium TaxID=1510 RepID=UPI0022495C52|nr:ATP-binding protein [Thermoclostridium stercorarium]UZQ84647.1 ATP-binding protein [Thermoclostridium stercorarium]
MNLNLSNVKIFSDEELLSHLWINLIDNAVKYTDDNGRISITLYETGDNIVFRISDNGKGMDEYTIKHIFDKFYQADKSRSTHGNGLGLSIVKRIVELCRGNYRRQQAGGRNNLYGDFAQVSKGWYT